MTAPRLGRVVAVSRDPAHRFSKQPVKMIELVAGIGVRGDAHAGELVQHRSRVMADPSQPNLRQVHLIHAELLDQLRANGFAVDPGQLGENITTSEIDLLALPQGTLLRIGATVELTVTGLRNPCQQINTFRQGMLKAVLGRDAAGNLERKAGIMATVRIGGTVQPADPIAVILPSEPHHGLEYV